VIAKPQAAELSNIIAWDSAMQRHSKVEIDNEATLLGEAARWLADAPPDALEIEALRSLADGRGMDFATTVLYQAVRRSERHGPTIAALEGASVDNQRLDADIVIVPGAFYREKTHTGADGHLVRKTATELGYRVEVVPLRSFGSVHGNAQILAEWLLQHGERPVVLVSHSKGSTEVRHALARTDAATVFRSVVGWVDLSGLFYGTPLVSWLRSQRVRWWLTRLLFWFKGYTFSALDEIDRCACPPWPGALECAPHLRVLHVVGFPLQRHLTAPLMQRGHRRLSPFGPNDGTIVLADVLALPGVVYPVWGADHYLRPSGRDMGELVARFLGYLAASSAPTRLTESGMKEYV